jgi:hypothetical protein
VIEASVLAGINGPVVAQFRAADFAVPGTTATDPVGKVWTVNRAGDATAEIVDRNTWAFTGTEFLRLPDRNELTFSRESGITVAAGFSSRHAVGTPSRIWSSEPERLDLAIMSGNVVRLQLVKGVIPAAAITRSYNDGAWHYASGHRQGGSIGVRLDGVSTTATDTTTGDINGTSHSVGISGGEVLHGLVAWIALFRRVLTSADHVDLAAWDGKIATEPAWLRGAAFLYVNAADRQQSLRYTAHNRVLNLVAK